MLFSISRNCCEEQNDLLLMHLKYFEDLMGKTKQVRKSQIIVEVASYSSRHQQHGKYDNSPSSSKTARISAQNCIFLKIPGLCRILSVRDLLHRQDQLCKFGRKPRIH